LAPIPPPPADLRRFPARTLKPETPLFRIHCASFGAWWFGSSGQSRFDLPEPQGTCYLALSPAGAFVETFGRYPVIPLELVDERRLAKTAVSGPARLADTTVKRALGFRCPLTIGASEQYERTQEWALAFAAHRFDGILYRLSHDPSARQRGVALFGPAGEQAAPPEVDDQPIDSQLLRDIRRRFRLTVAPSSLELREDTPRRRARKAPPSDGHSGRRRREPWRGSA
jgi:hypothetical protein